VHFDKVIQQDLAGFQQKAHHQGITLVIIKAFHILGTVALGQSIQVVKKSGINDLFLEFINSGGHQIVIALQIAFQR